MLSRITTLRTPTSSLLRRVCFSTAPAKDGPEKSEAELEAEKQAQIADDKLTYKNMEEHLAITRMVVTPPIVSNVPDYGTRESFPQELSELSVLDRSHDTMKDRTVLIRNPSKSSMTSGTHKTKEWRLIWENEERWTNGLMGWSSSADPMTNMTNSLRFDTLEQAINFCEKRGWNYETLQERKTNKKYGSKGYDENFLPKTVKAVLKAEKMDTHYFHRANAGTSNYFRPLKYHGDGEVRQHGPTMMEKKKPDVEGYYKQR